MMKRLNNALAASVGARVIREDHLAELRREAAGLEASLREVLSRVTSEGEALRALVESRTRELEERAERNRIEVERYYHSVKHFASSGDFVVHERLRALLRTLEPKALKGLGKCRLGSPHDGGYVCVDDFDGVSVALSFGVEQNSAWDIDVAAKGPVVHQFDHTVDPPTVPHKGVIFHKKRISEHVADDTATIPSLVELHDKGEAIPNLILKIDIENDEWPVFDATPPEVLSRFRQIIGEFHGFDFSSDRDWFDRTRRVFEKLTGAFQVVHVHGNNHSLLTNVGNVILPSVLEFTFANRACYEFKDTDELFPMELDSPNERLRPDFFLGSFRF